jgi:hypothetical protein
MQVKRRRGDDSGPKVERVRLVHENAMRGDDDDSDDDDSVHDFRRVQIIHKRNKRGAPLSATLTGEDKKMARKSTELQESLKTQTEIQASEWEAHRGRIQQLYDTHPLRKLWTSWRPRLGLEQGSFPCLRLTIAEYTSRWC